MWRWVAFPLLKWETAADFERQLLTDLTLSTDSYHWDGWLASFGQGCLRVSLDFTNMPPPPYPSPHTPPKVIKRQKCNPSPFSHSLICFVTSLQLRATCLSSLNADIRQEHDCCAWAGSHCSGISANKEHCTHCCVWMCVERVHEYYGMAGGGVVRQGRGGGRVGGELCAHGGRGQREWTTHGCYGNMAVSVRVCARVCLWWGGVAACFRWKDSCAYRIEGARWSVEDDGVALECMCTRTCMCKGHSSKSNGQWPDVGLCCYAICMSCTVGNTAKWPLECRERPHIFAAPAHWDLNLIP